MAITADELVEQIEKELAGFNQDDPVFVYLETIHRWKTQIGEIEGGVVQNLEQVLDEGNSAGDSLITDLLDPENPQDASTRAYVDNRNIANVLGAGNNADGAQLKNIGDGTDPQDAVSLAQLIDAASPTDTIITFQEPAIGDGNDLLLPVVSIDQDLLAVVIAGDHTARLPKYVPILINGDLRTAYTINYNIGLDQTTIATDTAENSDPIEEVGDGVLLPTIFQYELELPADTSVEWILAFNDSFGNGGATIDHGWLWIADDNLTKFSIRQEVVTPPDPFPNTWQWPRNTLFRDGLPAFALFDDVTEATSIRPGIVSYPNGTIFTVRLATLGTDGSGSPNLFYVTIHHHKTETVEGEMLS